MRTITVGGAQLGPIARDESRAAVVMRLIVMLREARARDCDLVVFPELALTTFFPRWFMTLPAEIDAFFESEMPGHDTKPLFDVLKRKATEGPHRFVVIMPQGEGGGGDPYERLAQVLQHLESEGLDAVGQVVHPDPFTAATQAVRDERVDEIIVSTFPSMRSGWLRRDLVERLRSETGLPVDHVVTEATEPAPA